MYMFFYPFSQGIKTQGKVQVLTRVPKMKNLMVVSLPQDEEPRNANVDLVFAKAFIFRKCNTQEEKNTEPIVNCQ